MLTLTDDPIAAETVMPPEARRSGWRVFEDLGGPDGEIWRALAGSAQPWTTGGPEAGATSNSREFWSRLVIIADAPSSQFDLLSDRLSGAVTDVGPTACVALRGRNFHGQRGRAWSAEPGNLHLSLALATGLSASAFGPSLTMLPAVAVVDAVSAASHGRVRPGIKWVNDVLLDGRKVAGVLTSTRVQDAVIDFTVLGIGVNVATSPVVAPTPFVPAVGCLRDRPGGDALTLASVLQAVLEAVAVRSAELQRHGPQALFRAYREHSIVIGQAVRIWTEGVDVPPVAAVGWPPPLAAGVVAEIGSDLGLRIVGRQDPVDRGRLAFEEVCRDLGC